MAAPRVWNAGSSCQGYFQTAPGVYTRASDDYGSVTCFVRVATDPNSVYMLTAGHVFRNCDRMFHQQCVPPTNNQITGLPPNRRDAGQPDLSWAEADRARANRPVLARSVGQYNCAGDKLGSFVDAGLAGVLPVAPPVWTNTQSAGGGGRILNAIDMQTPLQAPQLPPNEAYYLGKDEVRGLVYRPGPFNASWVDQSWNEATPTQLNNVFIRPYIAGVASAPAMSGQALVRGPPPAAAGAPAVNGTIVGMCLGFARDLDNPGQDTTWEIFQHISEAVNTMGITGLA